MNEKQELAQQEQQLQNDVIEGNTWNWPYRHDPRRHKVPKGKSNAGCVYSQYININRPALAYLRFDAVRDHSRHLSGPGFDMLNC